MQVCDFLENYRSSTDSIPIKYEFVSCDLCGSNDVSLYLEGSDFLNYESDVFKIVKCNKCGLVYLNPRPTQEFISHFYPEGYLPYIDNKRGIIDRMKSVLIKNDVRLFKKLMNRDDLKVLEVGCANGSYLSELKKLSNFEVTGVELSPSTADHARNTYNLKVVTGTIFDGKFQDSSFDVIIMRHVLEHVYNPSCTIREIHRILKRNGIFFFIVPNMNTVEVKIFLKYWHGWDLPRHLYHFNAESIKLMLEKNGFQNINISYQSIPNNWIGSLKYYCENKNFKKILQAWFNVDNVILLLIFFPVSYLAHLLHTSGRISVLAKKKCP
jgi:2-polyprenyl-3-methyl-5-hydroxy-6-metoxy-1,4-benzoquinol methylase